MNIKLTLYRYRKSAFSLLLLSLLSVTSMAVDAARTYKPIPQTPPILLDPSVLNNDFPSTNDRVNAVTGTADNKTIIGGAFSLVGGQSRPYLARLNADGTLDKNFSPNINFIVKAVAVQSDGKTLIGGEFTSVNGIKRSRIARLNINGSLDRSFNASVNGGVLTIALQGDGKIWLGGSFSNVNAELRQGIVRLNPDGTLDGDTAQAFGGAVMTIAIQDNGQVVLGGKFSSLTHSNDFFERHKIARLNADGSVDTGFKPDVVGIGVFALGLLKGKIIVGGSFTEIEGFSRENLAHLDSNGRVIDPKIAVQGGSVTSITVDTEDSYVISGNFTNVVDRYRLSNSLAANIVRIVPENFTGTPIVDDVIDRCFSHSVANGHVDAIGFDTNKNILIGGQFSKLDGNAQGNLARLYASQNISNYKQDTGFTNTLVNSTSAALEYISDFAVQEDNKILIVGFFKAINGIPRNSIARLHPDGSLDMSFEVNFSQTGWRKMMRSVAIQSDGKIIIGGNFTEIDGITSDNLARLNQDGTIDKTFPTFDFGDKEDDSISSLVIQENDEILFAGTSTASLDGHFSNIFRLSSDGILDRSFKVSIRKQNNVSTNTLVSDIKLKAGGKILIRGSFDGARIGPNSSGNIHITTNVARLNPNGSADESFTANISLDDTRTSRTLTEIEIQEDGNILVAGSFSHVDGVFRPQFARLNENGSLDTSFDFLNAFILPVPNSLSGNISEIHAFDDGEILVGGNFLGLFQNGKTLMRDGLMRLNQDGTIDDSFAQHCIGRVTKMLFHDNKLLLAGQKNPTGSTATRGNLQRLEKR